MADKQYDPNPKPAEFTDEGLDPAARDFDDTLSNPNSDERSSSGRGDDTPTARDLRQSEDDATPTEGLRDSRAGGVEAVRRAEADRGKSDSDRFNYQKEPDGKKKQLRGIANWSNRRKATVFGGAGGIGIAMFVTIFSLLPLKLPGLLDIIANEAGQRVEQVTEKRAKLIIGRAILTKFGTHTGIVLTGDGAFATLMASMRTARFEQKLAAKGLTIEQSGDGVRLKLNNELIGDGRTLRSDVDVLRALEGRPLTKKMIDTMVREEIATWRWMKRAKFAKWLRIKYGIPRYGAPRSDNTNDEERARELQEQRLQSSYDRVTDNAIDAFDCVMGDNCVADNLDGSTRGDDTRTSTNLGDLEQGVRDSGEELVEQARQNPFSRLSEKLSQTIVGKLGVKAIPIVGWIDLAATLDHIAYEALDNDYFSKLPAYFRGLSYAQMYGEWAGYSDQQKLGALDNVLAGPLAKQLDGAELSRAFSYIEGDATKGKPVNLKVNSNNPSEIQQYWEDYKSTIGRVPGAPGNVAGHLILNAYYETIGGGGLLGWLATEAGSLIAKLASLGAVFTPDSLERWTLDMLRTSMSKMLDFFGLTIDPLDEGADLFNDLHAGGTVSYNQFCKDELGCRKLTPEQTAVQNQTIAQDRTEYKQQQGLMYALFSPDEPTSLTTKFAVHMPSSPTGGLTSIANLVMGSPGKILGAVTPKTFATPYVDLYGVDPYGATAADLSQPISDEAMRAKNTEECPKQDKDDFNECVATVKTMETMKCDFEPESEGCSEETADEGTNAGEDSKFRIASFNIGGSTTTGEQGQANWPQRLDATTQVIKSKRLEVVGLQEVKQDQWGRLTDASHLGGTNGYGIYPTDYRGAGAGFVSENSIVWDKEKFTFVSAEDLPFMFNNAERKMPKVKLRVNETGQEIYVLNTHDPAGGGYNSTEAKQRFDNARAYAAKFKELASEGLPIFLTGDFNSGYDLRSEGNTTWQNQRGNLTYCIMTRDKASWDAYDAAKNPPLTGECPSRDNANSVDHIFLSTSVEVRGYSKVPAGHRSNGSDVHDTIIADVTVPGTGNTSGEWTWPIDKAQWPGGAMPIAECGLSYSNGTVHTGIDISVPTGTPIIAAANATVTYAGGGFGAIIAKTDQQTDTGDTIYLNYQHMSQVDVKVGDKIKAGQIIGKSGNVGTVAPHLHFGAWKTGDFLGGHTPIGSPAGRATLSQMLHPMNYLPKDGRNVSECKAPYVVP